ncbi:hypothetical protein [Streptomyces sp. NPDC060031]|uniref:hypothetical protein n=1 Tax=Streptomyces sp. NPDC060031 TaxID=3347043 RepID=UPI0036CFD802
MIYGYGDDSTGEIKHGWAPAHSWRWFLVRSAKHVPKAAKGQPQWKTLGASFFAILQAVGQAADSDGTNAFLGTDTLMAIGRCSKETVQKVLLAAEAMHLIKKTSNARGGRHPKPATYACTLPLGADAETGTGLDWERALAVLDSSEHDRRLRHKRAQATERHVTPSDETPGRVQTASHDTLCEAANKFQTASHDRPTGRHVTDQTASRDAPTRSNQALDHEMADAVDPPQVDTPAPPEEDPPPGVAESSAQPRAARQHYNRGPEAAANSYERHAATCERCPREMWCPQGSRLRKYLTSDQSRKRARHLSEK